MEVICKKYSEIIGIAIVKGLLLKSLIGRDTKGSILRGLFYGYGALCDRLITQISKRLRVRPKTVVTGVYASFVKKFTKRITFINEDLIFHGLVLIIQELD